VVVTHSNAARRSISVLSSFSDGHVSIVQTKDGAKFFGLTFPEPAVTPAN
jgi:hypothetical protein